MSIEIFDYGTSEKAKSPELWKERRIVFEYDPIDFDVIDERPEMDNDESVDGEMYRLLKYSMYLVANNKNGFLKKEQRGYFLSGEENTDDKKILVGKINNQLCILGDEESEVIISPLFDRLLKVTPAYIDILCEDERLRLSRGNYTMSESRPETSRGQYMEWAGDVPNCFEEGVSIKISMLEPTGAIEHVEQPVEYIRPLEASHQLFEAVEKKIIEHVTGGEPTQELAAKLQNVDEALHMPSVTMQGQSYTLTLRTSESADVIFLHNSSIETNQDRVAKSMLRMPIPEFLELAHDTQLQHDLMFETLSERGFHFVRQHNGQMYIMDRDMQRDALITPEAAHYPAVLQQVRTQLSDYFRAISEQKPASVPLRSIRIAAGIAIQEEAEKRELKKKTIGHKLLQWLGYE